MEPVFERTWRGTRKGCYERYLFYSNEVIEYNEWDRRYGNRENHYCDAIRAILPRNQVKFLGSFSVDYLVAIHLHLSNEWILRPENALRDKNLVPEHI